MTLYFKALTIVSTLCLTIPMRITRAESLEAAEAENARSINGGALPGGGQEQRDGGDRTGAQQRRSAFLQFVRRGESGLAPEQRALVQNTAGEILVPEDLEAEIIRSLPDLTVIRSLASQRTITTNRVRRRHDRRTAAA